MRIFAGGLGTETNTFVAMPTGLDDFIVLRGTDAAVGRIDHPGLDLSLVWGRLAKQYGYEFVFAFNAWAPPSGITVKAVYESLRDELLTALRQAMPFDVVLLSLHGAMLAEGYDDCEEDIIRRVRHIVGERVVIGVEFDLHCHLSLGKIAAADIVVTFKEYPHIDVNERAAEVFELAVATKLDRIRPVMALFDCQMVGFYPTTCQPLRALVDAMTQAEHRAGVLSVSFGHGFQFADLTHAGAKVLTIADQDPQLAAEVAREFGTRIYNLRRQIGFESLAQPMEQTLARALASSESPVVVADQSDNPGGGAPGDSTFALRWLLEHGARDAALAFLYDPEVVRIAKKAGVGTTLPIRLGGKLTAVSGQPIDVVASVLAVRDNYVHEFPQQSGPPVQFPAGDIVALRCGGIDVVVSSIRCQCCAPTVFRDVGLDPQRKQVLVIKSTQHFYAAFAPIAAETIYMAAPGALTSDPRQLSYQHLDTSRLYPWVENPFAL